MTSLNLETVDYPGAVQEAVDDTQKALNDARRFQLEAETYANEIVPVARGERERILQDAEAYKQRVIAEAEGRTARFLALLEEYQRAPRVTRDRLYIEAVEEVYSNSNKVIVDSDGSGSLMYLPLDQLMKRSTNFAGGLDQSLSRNQPQSSAVQDDSSTDSNRQRRVRQ